MKMDLKYVLVSSVNDLDSKVIDQISNNAMPSSKVVYLRGKSTSSKVHFNNVCNLYEKLGVTNIAYCNLDSDNDQQVIELISNCDILHLGGGHTFKFANRIKSGNYTAHLIAAIEKVKLVVGESAGAIILTDDLEVANILGENDTGNKELPLNLLQLSFLPHYNTINIDVSKYQTARERVIYGVNDGGAILINNDGEYHLYNVELL